MVYLFKTRNGELAARINVPFDQKEIIESDEIPWPDGVVVNKWMSKYQLRQQRSSNSEKYYKRYNKDDTSYHNDHTESNTNSLRVHANGRNNSRRVTYDRSQYEQNNYEDYDSYTNSYSKSWVD